MDVWRSRHSSTSLPTFHLPHLYFGCFLSLSLSLEISAILPSPTCLCHSPCQNVCNLQFRVFSHRLTSFKNYFKVLISSPLQLWGRKLTTQHINWSSSTLVWPTDRYPVQKWVYNTPCFAFKSKELLIDLILLELLLDWAGSSNYLFYYYLQMDQSDDSFERVATLDATVDSTTLPGQNNIRYGKNTSK